MKKDKHCFHPFITIISLRSTIGNQVKIKIHNPTIRMSHQSRNDTQVINMCRLLTIGVWEKVVTLAKATFQWQKGHQIRVFLMSPTPSQHHNKSLLSFHRHSPNEPIPLIKFMFRSTSQISTLTLLATLLIARSWEQLFKDSQRWNKTDQTKRPNPNEAL